MIVCRCERVTAGEIRGLIRAGVRDLNELKAITRAGMGACGGKTCPSIIKRLFREEGVPLKEQAVLYRAHHHAMEIQFELARRGIPFVVRSGVRFFEAAHIKDVLAHLRFARNPGDELALKRFRRLGRDLELFTTASVGVTIATDSSEAGDLLLLGAVADLLRPHRRADRRARLLVRRFVGQVVGFCESLVVGRGSDAAGEVELFEYDVLPDAVDRFDVSRFSC